MSNSSSTVCILNREEIVTTQKQNDSEDELFSTAGLFYKHVIQLYNIKQMNYFMFSKSPSMCREHTV